jgi:hypothetical protein
MSRPIRASLLTPTLVAAALGATLPAQEHRHLRKLFVSVEVLEPQQIRSIDANERATILQQLRATIVRALGSRFPHLEFTERNATDCCELQLALAPEGPFPKDVSEVVGAATWWHARLRMPGTGPQLETALVFRSGDDFWNRRPDGAGLVAETAAFFGAQDPATAPGSEGPVNSRHEILRDTMFALLPLELAPDIAHVGKSRIVVAKAPRREFGCSIPDGSLFSLAVMVPEPPLPPQRRQFLARLLSPAEFVNATLDDAARASFVILVEQAYGDATTATHVSRLDTTGPPDVIVERTVFLRRLGPVVHRCLETAPDELDLRN